MADEREWTIDDSSEELWAAIDELRDKKDRLMTINRTEAMSFNQRADMFKRQITTGPPGGKANAENQLRMLEQQKRFSEQNLQRNTRTIDTKIQEINRILEEKKVRDQKLLEEGLNEVQNDVSNLKETTKALAGQINVLRKEANERKAEFDKNIADIRKQAKEANEISEEMYSQLYALQADSQLLMAEYDAKQQNLREKQYIEENPSYSTVYSTVFSKVNEIFVASKALASGMVTREKYSDGDRAAQYMTLLTESIPFPAANMVMGCLTNRVQALSDQREHERVNNITSNANSFSEMDEICDWISRGLVFAYEEQICAMTQRGVAVFSECLVRGVMEFLSTPQHEREMGLNFVPNDEVDSDPAATLVSQLVVFLGRHDYKKREASIEKVTGCMPFMDFAMFSMFNKKTPTAKSLQRARNPVVIECRIPNVSWTDVGIFQSTGIRTSEQSVFHADHSQPDIYGYRLSTVRDAAMLGYFQYPKRAKSHVLPLNESQLARDPEAHSKFWSD
ncbi:hypothetical protein THRCLA_03313 [Thraustotheca clavata]|uniref:Uncharacterized protein n=1 Tax=Thraustotheca clavata TaxID=74557 RepID=A0A1W0A328_9STRA|nr:hypothetical protein THRCLA_03313 [Thraustotheca clavata]